MASTDISKRSRLLFDAPVGPGEVIYWMSRDQRISDNWAFLAAQQKALEIKRPLSVVFCLFNDFPSANKRHYHFLLGGLQDVEKCCLSLNINFSLLTGNPAASILGLIEKQRPALIVSDFDPLRIKRHWKKSILSKLTIPFIEVDAHNIVPTWISSGKREWAAYTFRPKIKRHLNNYLSDIPAPVRHPYPAENIYQHRTPWARLVHTIKDNSVQPVEWIAPGQNQALPALKSFLNEKLTTYNLFRNNPCLNGQSNLSPYLHFGHLAPQRVAYEVLHTRSTDSENSEAFLEELIVRRELSDNYCYYSENYDSFESFPEWAKKSLNAHRYDERQYSYTLDQFEHGKTHSPFWNACQIDMEKSGKLHGYLRMYWAKKILQWSASPEEALHYTLYLNDKYELDGRDPSGFTGAAWSIGGLHDRAWAEREIFGKIRYMNEKGCRRKFDVDTYITKVMKK